MDSLEEIRYLRTLYKDFLKQESLIIRTDKWSFIKKDLHLWLHGDNISKTILAKSLRTAMIAHREIGLGYASIIAILVYQCAIRQKINLEDIKGHYGDSTTSIVNGLTKAYSLYEKYNVVENENFRKLLMSISEDIRVIMIMIAERLDTMRNLKNYSLSEQQAIAREVAYLYAPLAHRMGLYAIKTELEDLSLKYTSNDIYKEIANKLNETKRSRDTYIANFIEPIKSRLEQDGINCKIKGRTKSIYSIWNKIKKQQVPFEKVYDLFAIRIIIDCPIDKEKAMCWQAFSILTDMYTANTNRLRDWISIPKSNGYESLHATVIGPEGKWVEVQIRTERMDEIAEKGLAAHWKYKGGKSDSTQMDEWLKNLRNLLENSGESDSEDVIDEFKMQLYNDEIFVFTPKGDLFRLPKDATVLDFAFHIHSNIGARCTGAIVNDKHASIRQILHNGDQVNIITSPLQKPSIQWFDCIKTSKARSHIRQFLKEEKYKFANAGREILLRRIKNWKLEYSDSDISRYAKKHGYKALSDFFVAINDEKINLQNLHDFLISEEDPIVETAINRSAEAFNTKANEELLPHSNNDVIIVDRNLKGISYTLAKCCNPIFGDKIFGFVTINGGIKIHKKDCPNAPQMISRFGYRVINAEWNGENSTQQYNITLKIIGHDDIGIVANISSIISKQSNTTLRSISIDSNDGLFEGTITVSIRELEDLKSLIKKITIIKGIKNVSRI